MATNLNMAGIIEYVTANISNEKGVLVEFLGSARESNPQNKTRPVLIKSSRV
jgi:hypothetical protein